MLERIARYWALDGADRRLLLRAMVRLAVVDAELRLPGLRHRARRHLATESPPDGLVDAAAIGRARWYARWLEVASRHHVVRARCLHRSLVLHRWLRREGLPSRLRIGVRKEGERLMAHAWVELGEEVVNDEAEAVSVFAVLAPSAIPDAWDSGIERSMAAPTAPGTRAMAGHDTMGRHA